MAYSKSCPDCGGSGEVILVEWRDGRTDDYTGNSYNIGDISEARKVERIKCPLCEGKGRYYYDREGKIIPSEE